MERETRTASTELRRLASTNDILQAEIQRLQSILLLKDRAIDDILHEIRSLESTNSSDDDFKLMTNRPQPAERKLPVSI